MDWRRKLTKGEKAHLRGVEIRTRAQLADQMRRDSGKEPMRRCMECKAIARKLGMETDPPLPCKMPDRKCEKRTESGHCGFPECPCHKNQKPAIFPMAGGCC